MCGISGFNWMDERLGVQMSECLLHRGPDAAGVFSEDGITLSHRRLSIIDLSPEANQPMTDSKEELVIIFNGEIYNYLKLKEELKEEYKFKTKSDTEVILAGFRKWGKEVVKHLNGIFSLAIWDKRNSTLFLARDHMGVKPLYYHFNDGKFIFASELKSILAHPIERKLDLHAFNEYLRVLYVPEPRTMIQGISKLSPGHTLALNNGQISIEEYYKPVINSKPQAFEEAKDKVLKAVEEAVRKQLVADVPVGVYLSGGIDSSVVLACVSKIKKNVKTFSVGFELEDGDDSEKFNRDFKIAEETAKYFGAEHYPLTISVKDVADSMEEIIGAIDDPISNPTAIPMAHLSKFAKQYVTVVLSGNGGDELFGGYERYRMSRKIDFISKIPWLIYLLPDRIRNAARMSSLDRLVQFEFIKDKDLRKVIDSEYLKPLEEVRENFKKYLEGSQDKTESLMLADLRSWLPDQALTLGDKMSMKGSLEERVPLLDREVVNLAMSLPLNYKVTPFKTKKIFKDAFRKILPETLFKEPKRGWFSPGAKWLRKPEVQSVAYMALNEGYNESMSGLFNWQAVNLMLERHIKKEEYNLTIIWMILTFQIWAKKYKISLPNG